MELSQERQDQIIRLSEGNPGAMTVLVETIKLFGLNALDEVEKVEGLRGPEIWMLYKDVNGQLIGPFFTDVLEKSGWGDESG